LVWWLPPLWGIVTVAVYALRLPVAYQHGRYLMPVIPPLLVYGLGWTLELTGWRRLPRLLGPVLTLSLALSGLLFWLHGAQAYRNDVAIIEGEMVAVARWLNENTAPDDLIAVHDIGAVGYLAHRPLLDLAGLINPEVVPFIRDEARLREWLREQGADYLVTFPSWYPELTSGPWAERVYTTAARVTVLQGGENMAVYRLR